MARDNCVRCDAVLHTTTEPPGSHLCKDIAARQKRRERQVQRVVSILARKQAFLRMDGLDGGFTANVRDVAEDIVKQLSQMGVTED